MEILRGTLDLVVLKTIAPGPLHGYAIATAIREKTRSALDVQEGVLYPTLKRLEQRGYLESAWGLTETGREARFYKLTRSGRDAMRASESQWRDYVKAMSLVLRES